MKRLLTNLKFYDNISDQYHRIYYNLARAGIYTPNEFLPPFQFADRSINTITSVHLMNANTNLLSKDITSDITLVQKASGNLDYVLYYGDNLSDPVDNGIYYIQLTDGTNTWYSDLIRVCDNLIPDNIIDIARTGTSESTTSRYINTKAEIYICGFYSRPHDYFATGETLRFQWDSNDITMTSVTTKPGGPSNTEFVGNYTLSEMVHHGWYLIINDMKSNPTIKNDFDISPIINGGEAEGILFRAKNYGSEYNLQITSSDTDICVADYTTDPDFEAHEVEIPGAISYSITTIELPQNWQWYTRFEKTYFNRYKNSYKKGSVQISNNQVLPFIVRRSHSSDPLTHFYLKNPNTNEVVVDLLTLLSEEPYINYIADEGIDYIVYYGKEKFSSDVSCGIYYGELTDGTNTWYSDLIQVYGENIIPQQTTYGIWEDGSKMAWTDGGYALWQD